MKKASNIKTLKEYCHDITAEAKEKNIYNTSIRLYYMSREQLNKFVRDHKLKVSENRDK